MTCSRDDLLNDVVVAIYPVSQLRYVMNTPASFIDTEICSYYVRLVLTSTFAITLSFK